MNLRKTVLLLALWLGVALLVYWVWPWPELKAAAGGTLPEQTPGWTAPDVLAALESLGDDGRRLYLRFQILDAFVALLQAVALLAVLREALSRAFAPDSKLHALESFPLLVAWCELLENACLFGLGFAWPSAPSLLVIAGGGLTTAKMVTLGITAALVVGAVLLATFRRRGRTDP